MRKQITSFSELTSKTIAKYVHQGYRIILVFSDSSFCIIRLLTFNGELDLQKETFDQSINKNNIHLLKELGFVSDFQFKLFVEQFNDEA